MAAVSLVVDLREVFRQALAGRVQVLADRRLSLPEPLRGFLLREHAGHAGQDLPLSRRQRFKQQPHPLPLFPHQQVGIQIMLGRDIAPLDEPLLDPLQPPLLVLEQVADGRPAGIGPRVPDRIPPLEHFYHRGGHCVLSLMRIPAREDDVPHEGPIGIPEELLKTRHGDLAYVTPGLVPGVP